MANPNSIIPNRNIKSPMQVSAASIAAVPRASLIWARSAAPASKSAAIGFMIMLADPDCRLRGEGHRTEYRIRQLGGVGRLRVDHNVVPGRLPIGARTGAGGGGGNRRAGRAPAELVRRR